MLKCAGRIELVLKNGFDVTGPEKLMFVLHDAALQRHYRPSSRAYAAVFNAYAVKSLFACYQERYQQRLCSRLDFSKKIGLHGQLAMNHRRLKELLHSSTWHSVAFTIRECVTFLGFEFQCFSASMRISKAC